MGKKIRDNKALEDILLDAQYLRLGLCSNEKPYIVPISFGYKDNTIYLHSSRKGTKINLIKQNKNVCFEVDTFYETLPSDEPCSYYMKYQSVVGYGTATILEDEKEIKEGLKIIIDRYHNKEYSIDDLDVKGVAVIRIDIDDLHGRQYGMNDE
ncbi:MULTISPECIES: pyridoxamine 5'-phosphate oxidase family protein [Methanococcoides]|uniref:Nitroimidazol reductase NimA-like FMN-containing flavoprotein (Pyridoxamine 5'-phosphate oxidase superfamily) n=2 Tax=Methanococcoides TaxID=2225 RepID=A0AA90TX60_9EURY|nr:MULTISPECIES: pyridoxamine 5'-phosphate oxidase family protein [Methanococcoides]ABE52060.1 Pyridoxamine 5'-phosphate oxidase domain protein [Methanococcoides burtonii DSM 6242]MDA0525354.1 pyridoxamine 5'-phosphate oxidase family protein [Methanococcoides alaskense]MDR6221716.1 nitroimidazol reductase NimA-like FMN-containing flavoprotein (pyridoxamine 5'-phosphate oxidase superfamily) [Methanococcoides alaskense]